MAQVRLSRPHYNALPLFFTTEYVTFSNVPTSSMTSRSGIVDPSTSMLQNPLARRKSVHFEDRPAVDDAKEMTEDPNDEYFARENADFMEYWHSTDWQRHMSGEADSAQMREWGELQDSWDSFEATASGIRSVPNYQFQPHNPYLVGAEYQTRNHMAHMDASQVFYEVSARIGGPSPPILTIDFRASLN